MLRLNIGREYMKTKLIKFVWLIILIALVGLTFASFQGHVAFDRFLGWKSFIIFAGISIISFVCFVLEGIKKWGWLFPALISASLALNALGVFSSFGSPIVAFPLLLSCAIPFYVGYLVNRNEWSWLIPAWLLTLIALIPALVPLVNEGLLISLLLYSLSFPFVVACINDPGRRLCQVFAAFFLGVGAIALVNAFIHAGNMEPLILFLFAAAFTVLILVGAKVAAGIILKMKVTRQVSS